MTPSPALLSQELDSNHRGMPLRHLPAALLGLVLSVTANVDNLIGNPGFESEVAPWVGRGGASLERTMEDAHSGEWSLRVGDREAGGNPRGGPIQRFLQRLVVIPPGHGPGDERLGMQRQGQCLMQHGVFPPWSRNWELREGVGGGGSEVADRPLSIIVSFYWNG